MPTTSNFGWTTPADTDLVKDGALAIRTLGNGIDTSLIDLKGGTTGQVLSKATNTDLDYTWITPNVGDITEVQAGTGISVASGTGPIPVVTNTVATAFDAKADLVAGTGADTFAKLTVGADYGFLQALAVETTGLKWNDGAWTSYTPTLTAATGTFTTATVSGRYIRLGKLVIVQQSVAVTTNGTAAGEARVTLPFTGSSNANVGVGREVNVTGNLLQGEVGTTYIGWRNYDNSYPLGNSRTIFCTAAYEVA